MKGGDSEFQNYHIISFKWAVFNNNKEKNHKAFKEPQNMTHPKEKNKPTETVPDKYLIVDLLQKNSKATILKMVKELKEDMGKVKKTMYEQSGNINKEILKR